MDETGTVNAVSKSLDIFEVLRDHGPAGVTAVADRLGLSKSSVHKHLKTLRRGGLVTKHRNEYKLSYRLLRYTTELEGTEFYRRAESVVDDLAEDVDELVVFSIKEETRGVFVISRKDRYGFTESLQGKTFYLNQNASGKSILARCTRDEIDRVLDREGLPRATENTITDPDELHDELQSIRNRGFAINRQERNEFQSIGAGVTDPQTGMKAALTIGGPPKRMTTSRLKNQFADRLLGAVNDIEIQLKYGD